LDEGGNEVPQNSIRDFTEKLIETAHEKFNNKLVVQWNSLQKKARIPNLMSWSTKFHIPFGYQIAEAEFANPECLKNKTPCDEELFKSLFDKGERANAAFIEIFSKDVIAFPEAMAYGHEKFSK